MALSLSAEMMRQLAPIAAAAGIDLGVAPDGKLAQVTIPPVHVKLDPVTVAQMVGDQLRDEMLFVTPAGEVVELMPDGKLEPMDATRFVTWAGERILFFAKKNDEGKPIRTGIKKDLAAVLLASNGLKSRLRVLQRVLPVRVPTLGKDGKPVLLPEGYDYATGTYVLERLRYETDWNVERSAAFLREFVRDFPWGDSGRSLSVWACSALAPFCQVMCPSLPPMFGFLANKAGSGKTILAMVGPCAVHGRAGVQTWNREDGKLEEQLNSYARANAPFLILDNVKGHVSSELLEAWLTSRTWNFRRFHSQTMVDTQKNTITYLSGNDATFSDDLIRRSLLVELFADMDADDRAAGRASNEIDEEVLSRPDVRRSLLAAMWGMVRHWGEVGMPTGASRLPSFVAWGAVVPGIVMAAGFDDPCQRAEMISGGDKSRTEFVTLMEAAREAMAVAAEAGRDLVLKLPEWAALARKAGIYYEVLGSTEEMHAVMVEKRLFRRASRTPEGVMPFSEDDERHQLAAEMEEAAAYMDRSMSTKFAGILHRKRDNKKRLKDGAIWQFGSRKGRRSEFAMVRVSAPEEPVDAPLGDPF